MTQKNGKRGVMKMARAQTCKRCGRTQYVIWQVSDETWKVFCQKTGWDSNKTICLECFAELIGFVDLGDITQMIYQKRLWDKEG